ncbi:TEA domain-containing protein [Favolaschia claudopus]|uniref:TEA domain-containing protein n=1 Tax=Favolaschia claudopus TaxID=2862362 RepID=A0AAW0AYC4_9AGAR
MHSQPIYSPVPPSDQPWHSSGSSIQESLHPMLEMRKMRRMTERGEAIWPLHLESALVEGLHHYQPTVCRETVMLKRYPGRNQFLSNYIFDKTGERRTPKQVASRLQQMREAPLDEEMHDLLFPSPYSSPKITSTAQLSAPDTCPISQLRQPTVIPIDILPEIFSFGSYDNGPRPLSSLIASRTPWPLSCIDPTVTLISHASHVHAQSQFFVYKDNNRIVHTETAPLTSSMDFSQPNGPQIIHAAKLVPEYWITIVESPDPTRFSILHEVVNLDDNAVIFSALYVLRFGAEHFGAAYPAVNAAVGYL